MNEVIGDVIPLLQEFERGPGGGFAAQPYRCPAGKKTVGWGHVIEPQDRLKLPLTAESADELLRQDALRFAASVAAGVRVKLTPAMHAALTSFAFNVGYSAFLGSTLVAFLNAGQYEAAANEFQRWNKATVKGKKVALPGLTRRRDAERALFLRDGVPS